MSRLVFVEGFPGAGKSTTAQFPARQLARRGDRARWVYEGEAPNPFVSAPPGNGYKSWEQFADRRLERFHCSGPRLAREPLAGAFRRRD